VSEPSAKRGLPVRVKMRHGAHFVEELTRRHDAPIGHLLPLSALRPNPQQPRSAFGDLSDLVASIRDKGILEPILVRRAPDATPVEESAIQVGAPKPQFQIISGERRYRAALEAGLFEVPVIEMEVSDQEALEIALIENLQRKDLSPFEEADGYRALAEAHQYSQEAIAKAVGKARSSIAESLSLLRIPPRARETAMALGVSTKSTLLEVLKAGSEAKMIEMLERVARHGLSRDDVREERSKPKSRRRKPYVFRFRAPDRNYQLSLTFRQSTVEKDDLIRALEQILTEIRASKD
jgi:ParB family chromosome partitioning protein